MLSRKKPPTSTALGHFYDSFFEFTSSISCENLVDAG
jgi:hypothetical protein